MSFVYPAGCGRCWRWACSPRYALIRHRSGDDARIQHIPLAAVRTAAQEKGLLAHAQAVAVFALQFLALTLSALLIAQPIMPMPGSGVNVAVILDASASMQMADGADRRALPARWRRRARHGQAAVGRRRDGGAGRGRGARCGGSRQRRRGASRGAGGRFVRLGRGRCGGRGGAVPADARRGQYFGRAAVRTRRMRRRRAGGRLPARRGRVEREPQRWRPAAPSTARRLKPRCRALAEARMSFELIVDGRRAARRNRPARERAEADRADRILPGGRGAKRVLLLQQVYDLRMRACASARRTAWRRITRCSSAVRRARRACCWWAKPVFLAEGAGGLPEGGADDGGRLARRDAQRDTTSMP